MNTWTCYNYRLIAQQDAVAYKQPRHAQHGKSKGLESQHISSYIQQQTCSKRDQQQRDATHIGRQHQDEKDTYIRHYQAAQRNVVEHYHLKEE